MWWHDFAYGNAYGGWGGGQGWATHGWWPVQSDRQAAAGAAIVGAPAPQSAVAAWTGGAPAPQSAVAAGTAGAPAPEAAVAAPPIPPPPGRDPPREVFDLAHFQRLKVDVHWTQHNITLKFLRHKCLMCNTKEIVFGPWPEFIPLCIHGKGPDFKFDELSLIHI